MLKRRPPSPADRNAAKQRRYRQRVASHEVIAPVRVNETLINFLIGTGWLAERDSHKRERIADAIARMIAEAERHP